MSDTPRKTLPPKGALQKWLLAHLSHEGEECLIWPFNKSSGGYGFVVVDGVRGGAHRFMCALVHGPPPSENLYAAHACGVPSCVNPRHLRWATGAENQADRIIHGTTSRGEKNASAKLTDAEVVEIRRLLSRGLTQRKIAKRFGVSQSQIYRIANKKNRAAPTDSVDLSTRRVSHV